MKNIIADPNIPELEVFSEIGHIEQIPGREWTNKLIKDADILLSRSVTRVNQSLLQNTKVGFVGTATSGFDHVDKAYLQKQGITFSYCPGSNANSVAEYVFSAILTAKKPDQELQGMTAGIIGCGHVGGRVAELLAAVGVKCVLNDPPLAAQTEKTVYSSLQAALGADIVTLHTPLIFTGEHPTYHLISTEQLEQMKSNCILINCARGGVVNEAALLQKIKRYSAFKTVIDCWEREPAIDHDLLREVTLGTPHIAGYSYDGKIKATMMLYQAVCDYLQIKPSRSFRTKSEHRLINFFTEASMEQLIRQAVFSAYDVRSDHRQTKALLYLSRKKSSLVFDQLRKNYPKRHEFDKFEVKITDKMPGLEQKLKQIGFVIRGIQ